MKNKQLREIVTELFCASNENDASKLESYGIILTQYLKDNPDRQDKVKRMIAGLEVKLEKFIEQENKKNNVSI